MTERMTVVPEQPPLSRDSILHEISRSLRATHPDRAEQMIAEVERRMPIAEPKPGEVPMWARPIGHMLGSNVSVTVDGVDVTNAFTATEFDVPE